MDWILISDRLPPEQTELRIRLKNNPTHDPGNMLWMSFSSDKQDIDIGMFVGYNINHFCKEVSHWALASDTARAAKDTTDE